MTLFRLPSLAKVYAHHPARNQVADSAQGESLLPRPLTVALAVGIVLLLAWSSTYSYVLFHALVELFAIGVAALIGVIAWYTYPFSRNNFLLFLGFAYPWIGAIDLGHAFSYKGMGLFPWDDPNPSVQLWIAARALESVVLLVAPLYLLRHFNRGRTLVLFAALAVGLVASVILGYFPDAFIEGEGLTEFKIGVEYVIIAVLIAAWVHLQRRRELLDRAVLGLIGLSIGITAVGELFFTSYADVYGLSNLAGHVCKLASFWLIFLGLVHTSLREPFRIMNRDATTYDAIPDQIVVVDGRGYVRQVNRVVREAFGAGRALLGQHCHTLLHPGRLPRANCPVCRRIEQGRTDQNIELFDRDTGRWVSVSLAPVRAPGALQGMVHVGRDITDRKQAEMEVRKVNRALYTISVSNHALVHGRHETQLLADICRTITQQSGYRMAWVGYVEDDRGKTIRPMAFAGEEAGYLSAVRFSWSQGETGQGPAGTAIRSRRAVTCNNIATEPSYLPWRDEALRRGYVSTVAFPLCAYEGERPFGVLVIYSEEPQAFTEEECHLLQQLAGDLAYGIRALRTRLAHEAAERNLERVNRALRTISACNLALVRAREESRLLGEVCRIIVEQGGYQTAWVGYREEQLDGPVRCVAQAGGKEAACEQLFAIVTGEAGDGLIERAIRSAREVIVNDIRSDASAEGWRERAMAEGYASAVALPLHGNSGFPFGVLMILSAEASAFTTEEVQLLTQLGDDLTYGIRALRMRRERDEAEQSAHDWLERFGHSMTQTVEAIAATIEKRDPYTAGHQRRVRDLAVAIATRMGLESNQIEGIRMGGVIHDIGKIAIPAEILNRPGSLSALEFEIIKVHPSAGYDILKGVEFPWPVAAMVHQHHERLDGSGYPRRLKGREIILEARILAVADVVEAMANHRPYRPGLGIEAALAELERNVGTLFDKRVVAHCIGLFRADGYRLR